MPLSKEIFINNLSKIFDSNSFMFEKFPESFDKSINLWVNAFYEYIKTIFPISTTLEQSRNILYSSILKNKNNLKQSFEKCFINCANTIAIGMQPTFSSTISTDLNFNNVYVLGYRNKSSRECIIEFVNIIDIWLKNCVSINNFNGLKINWY